MSAHPRISFLMESYWRDHLCLSWDFHTWHGPDEISFFLRHQQKGCRLRQASIDGSGSDKKPKLVPIDHDGSVHGLQVFIEIETNVGTGKNRMARSGRLRLNATSKTEVLRYESFALITLYRLLECPVSLMSPKLKA